MNDLIYEYIRGSHLYGLNIESSDEDRGGVYIQNIDEILGLRSNYNEQKTVNGNDIVFYELGRWIELLIKGNPNMIEGLFAPEKMQIIKPHKILEPIFANRDKFLTKELAKILTQYAHSQIQKARGLNKAIVNPIEERKDILDFCYTFKDQGSIPIKQWLQENGLFQEYCGLVNIAHCHDVYGVYYDFKKHWNELISKKEDYTTNPLYNLSNNRFFLLMEKSLPIKNIYDDKSVILDKEKIDIQNITETHYRGIMKIKDTEESNEVRLSSVEKDIKPLCYMTYNKTGYQKHCVDYKNYQEWKKNRNPERFRINTESQRHYDVKNISHCIRLLTMGEELIDGKGFLVDRTNIDRDFILSVKMGEWDYDKIMKIAEDKKKYIEENISTCNLPDVVDVDFFNSLLIDMRKQFLMIS